MLTEAEPHIRRISRGEGWVETRSPNCPEELNPFREIPVETELIQEDIAMFRVSLLNEVRDNTGTSIPTPECFVRVHNNPGKPLLIEIQFYHPPAEERGEFARMLIHRFNLYGNNVSVKQVVDLSDAEHSSGGVVMTETILSQEFVTADPLLPLNYALRALQQSH